MSLRLQALQLSLNSTTASVTQNQADQRIAIPNNNAGVRARVVSIIHGNASFSVGYIQPGDSTVSCTASTGMPLGVGLPTIIDVAGQTHIAIFSAAASGSTFTVSALENQ